MLFIGLQWKARKPIGIPRNPIRPWRTDGVGVNTRRARAGRWAHVFLANKAGHARGRRAAATERSVQRPTRHHWTGFQFQSKLGFLHVIGIYNCCRSIEG